MESEQKEIKSKKFKVIDIILIVGMILPLVLAMTLKVMTHNVDWNHEYTDGEQEDIAIAGAQIYFEIDAPIQPLVITESQVNSWLVMLTILCLCLYLTHGIKERPDSVRQHLAEWIVEKCEGLVGQNMGDFFSAFPPFVCAILALSAFSSLITLIGLYPPTSDINVVAGWALLVFILITHYKMKCGVGHYLHSFLEPVPFLMPLNVIGEVATPVSMAFRHYGNVLSGSVISVLIAALLQSLSRMLLGWLPGVLGEIPFLQIGLPAILSLYFDIFSGGLQAFIFAMLTMLYVASAFPADDYAERMRRKSEAKLKKEKIKN